MAEYKVQIEERFRTASKYDIVARLNVYIGPFYHGFVWSYDEKERTAIIVVPDERFRGNYTEEKFLEDILKKEFVNCAERIKE